MMDDTGTTMPTPSTKPVKTTFDVLEEARSKVLQRLAYGAGVVGAFALVWGIITNDGELKGWGTGLISAVLGFWIGKRSAK